MGGAVFASLDGETNFATVPERIEVALRSVAGAAAIAPSDVTRKADRLPPVVEANSLRRVIPQTRRAAAPTTAKSCACAPSCGSPAICRSRYPNSPPISRRSIRRRRCWPKSARRSAANADDAPDDEADAEVSFFTRDLAAALPKAKIAAVAADRRRDRARARHRQLVRQCAGAAPAPILRQNVKMAYAAEGTPDPYAGFEARIVPENITLLPKTTTQTTGGNDWNEKTVTLKKGDSISTVLRDLGAKPEEIKAITAALGARGRDGGVKEGQKLRILLSPAGRRQTAAAGPRGRRQRHQLSRPSSRCPISANTLPSTCAAWIPRSRRPAKKRKTTARACGSTRASTRPRCATRCRAR